MQSSRPNYFRFASGAGLVLVRLSLAAVLAHISLGCDGISSIVSAVAAVLACLLSAGFLTRAAAVIFAAAGLLAMAFGETPFTCFSLVLEAIALALLGPGAWSIDALRRQRDWLSRGR